MIPRLHKRGQSFKGVCNYILHDAGKSTNERVLWVDKRNLAADPENAWFEMFATARDQAELKASAGMDARGRKNFRPVLHLSLSWAVGENPTPEHMRQAALGSLKALGLDQHQAVIASHGDKDHLHLHIVVNTIHPETGMTAPLKYTKERLSRWAEAYEREHGIHCEERIRNNEKRKEIASARETDPSIPFVPVKHGQTSRKEWFDKKELLDRMKALRAELRPLMPQPHPEAVGNLKEQHRAERDLHYRSTASAVDHARSAVFMRYRPQWRELYSAHKKETKHLQRAATHPFERAVFVFTQRERLGNGKPLTLRQMVNLIVKPDRLLQRVEAIQAKERRSLAREEKTEKKRVSERLWLQHKSGLEKMKERQQQQRFALVRDRETRLRTIVTLELAKESLIAGREGANANQPAQEKAEPAANPAQHFNTAVNTRTPAQTASIEKIKRQMEEWRKRSPGRDFGREM